MVASFRLLTSVVAGVLAALAFVHCGTFSAAEDPPPVTTDTKDAQAGDGTASDPDGPVGTADGAPIDSPVPEAGVDATPCTAPQTRLVFVTSTAFTAGLGRKYADGMCQADANAAGLCGNFVAWLSMSGSNAIDRLADAPYDRVDGVRVVDNKNELKSTGIRAAINQTALGGTPPYPQIWTGTETSGMPDSTTCNGWTASTGAVTGTWGDVNGTGGAAGNWTDRGDRACSTSTHAVVCFQE